METQETIAAWGRETFGEPDALAIGVRMNCEVAELLVALRNIRDAGPESAQQMLEDAGLECADIAIMLDQVADALGVDLDKAKTHKMAINRARTWGKTASGKVQHVDARKRLPFMLIRDHDGECSPIPIVTEFFLDDESTFPILLDRYYALWDSGSPAYSQGFTTAEEAVVTLKQAGYDPAGIAIPSFLGNNRGFQDTEGINIFLGADLYVFHAFLSDTTTVWDTPPNGH